MTLYNPAVAGLRYLALGDSYTIGTGASRESSNFPSYLARRLREEAGAPVQVHNPAVDGFTTRDLIDRELVQVAAPPDLCTVLIGANDVVQRVAPDGYRRNLGLIYDFVRSFELAVGRVAALSIPDFSRAPTASTFGAPAALSARIDAFNAIARQEAQGRGFLWIDLTEVSRSGADRPGWWAADRLHPSDAQYLKWAGWIWESLGAAWVAAAS